ncbi:MAG: AAA family ATPase [Cycloclasticus sp.]
MKERLQRLFEALSTGLIERETPLKLALLSAIAGEHTLLLGAHGTAKSVLAQRLHLAFKEGEYFERLLTRFSVPEELFGPLSIKSLENDRYQRLTKHYLPSATIAFIDEIFKANSAILNSLLTVLNEREFDNGDKREHIPLISVIGASNELPADESLAALYDRFLCRYQVTAVSADNFTALLNLSDAPLQAPHHEDQLNAELLSEIQQGADKLVLSDEVLDLLHALRLYVAEISLYVSDRRWRKVVKLLKVSAFTNQQSTVSIWDCWLLQHCLWDEPRQKQLIADWLKSQVGIGSGFNSLRLDKLVVTWEQVFQDDAHSEEQVLDDQGAKLYNTVKGEQSREESFLKKANRDGLALYLSPPDQDDRTHAGEGYTRDELSTLFFDDRYQQSHIEGRWQHIDRYIADPENRLLIEHKNTPCMVAKRHTKVFIEARLAEVFSLQQSIQQFEQKLQQQIDELQVSVVEHIWLESEFIVTAGVSLDQSIVSAQSLVGRLDVVLSAYRGLPTIAA